MSLIAKKKLGRDGSQRWAGLALAWLLALSAGPAARAQVTVDTIGGGVRVECGSSSGFAGGNTWSAAQFNDPVSCALDTNGNLWIADHNNSDIEEITQAGNKSSSVTYQIKVNSNSHWFTNVVSVAIDPADNLYAMLPSPPTVVKVTLATAPSSLNILGYLKFSNIPSGTVASAMTVDGSSNVFIAFTNGVIVKFQMLDNSHPPTTNIVSYGGGLSPALHFIVSNGFAWNPAGLALMADGKLAVSDKENNAIWVVSTNDYTANPGPQLLVGANGAGFDDGSPAFAKLDQPSGLAATADGSLIVCDTQNNRVRLIDNQANTTTLYGTPSSEWPATCCTCDPTLYAGWVDGVSGITPTNATGRAPVSCAIGTNGQLFVTESYYSLIREVIGTTFAQVNLRASLPIASTLPASGVSSTNATLIGTVNPGDEPTYYFFEWGTNASYGSYTATNLISTSLMASQTVGIVITQLSPGTIYHFQLVASNGLGFSYGGDQTFVTPAEPAIVSTLPASSVTSSTAVLNASVNPEYSVTSVYFQWGTTTNFGFTSTPITLASNLGSFEVVSQAIGNLQTGTIYYFQATAFNSGGTTAGNIQIFSTPYVPPPTVTVSPSNGYYPNCVTVTVTSTSSNVYYTTTGVTPTTNSTQVPVTFNGSNYVGFIDWCNSQANLSQLQILSGAGTNTTLVQGSLGSANQIGFPQALFAGPGEHLYVPVVADLVSNATLESLQFRAEITPTLPNTNKVASITLQPLTDNDLVLLPGPAPLDAPVSFTTYSYSTATNGSGLVVTAPGGSSGLDMAGAGVVVMLHFQVPTNATAGEVFSLNILDVSGTSDGQQTAIAISPLPIQTLTITDPPYLVGDSSPSLGYNAGQFGNGSLDNSDVNNAIYASAGIRVPPTDSDIFGAMDAWPPDSGGVGGDGLIRLLDWETILARSLGGIPLYPGLDTNNYIRFWTNGDTGNPSHQVVDWYPGGPPVSLIASRGLRGPGPKDFDLSSSPPGLEWFCQASVGAGSVTNAQPGSTYSLPVYANVLAGYDLAALQFRATLTGSPGAPAVSSIAFTPASEIPYPDILPGLNGADKVIAWGFGSFASPLIGSNYLGTISFQVPASASRGESYALHFSGVDGAPGNVEYELESFPGSLWVMSADAAPASITSDEWKIYFFGSYSNSLAADNVDADSDGALNWQEYVAGTNPTNAASRLQFNGIARLTNAPNTTAINWLTAPGKTYILQSSPSLTGSGWTPVNTNTGDGNFYQCVITNLSGNTHFYQLRLSNE